MRLSPCFVVPCALACLLSSAAAQVPPGSAVLLGGTTLLQVVDPAGAATTVTGLDPASQAASAVLAADDGLVYLGLGATSAGGPPASLDLRLLVISGGSAIDVPYVSLMQVPAQETWRVADIKERDDGSLLVLATEVVLGPNPSGASAVFTVDAALNVQQVPTTGIAVGVPKAICDLGDRFAVAVDQPFFVHNVQVQSLDFAGVAPVVDIVQLVGVGMFGGFDRDVSGEIVFGGTFGGSTSTVHRVEPTNGATVVPVPSGPRQLEAAHVNRAGILSSVSFGATSQALERCDTWLGGTTSWSPSVGGQVFALSVRDNPEVYGLSLAAPMPALGTFGAEPVLPNPAWGLRLFDPSGQQALVFLGGSPLRAQLPSPFGTLLVDVNTGFVGFGFQLSTAGVPTSFGLPLPNDPVLVGADFAFQALVAPAVGNAVVSSAVGIKLQ